MEVEWVQEEEEEEEEEGIIMNWKMRIRESKDDTDQR